MTEQTTTPDPAPTIDGQRAALAETIAEAIGHERDEDSPECRYVDDTLGCRCPGGHPPVPGCETCGEWGWPCGPALAAADAVLASGVLEAVRAELARVRPVVDAAREVAVLDLPVRTPEEARKVAALVHAVAGLYGDTAPTPRPASPGDIAPSPEEIHAEELAQYDALRHSWGS